MQRAESSHASVAKDRRLYGAGEYWRLRLCDVSAMRGRRLAPRCSRLGVCAQTWFWRLRSTSLRKLNCGCAAAFELLVLYVVVWRTNVSVYRSHAVSTVSRRPTHKVFAVIQGCVKVHHHQKAESMKLIVAMRRPVPRLGTSSVDENYVNRSIRASLTIDS